MKFPQFRAARRIAFYFANDGEIDLSLAFTMADAMGKRAYFPVFHPVHSGRLSFAPWRRGMALKRNRFGIFEPDVASRYCLDANKLDIVLTPLVAFAPNGGRLGMGGGYYDRTFAFLSRRRYLRKPRLVGVAYAFQKVEQLPLEPWDVFLEGVMTEAGFFASRSAMEYDVAAGTGEERTE